MNPGENIITLLDGIIWCCARHYFKELFESAVRLRVDQCVRDTPPTFVRNFRNACWVKGKKKSVVSDIFLFLFFLKTSISRFHEIVAETFRGRNVINIKVFCLCFYLFESFLSDYNKKKSHPEERC